MTPALILTFGLFSGGAVVVQPASGGWVPRRVRRVPLDSQTPQLAQRGAAIEPGAAKAPLLKAPLLKEPLLEEWLLKDRLLAMQRSKELLDDDEAVIAMIVALIE